MIKQSIITLSLLYICSFYSVAQGVKGKVTDSNKQPIDAVAVILQTPDSLFVDAGITNDEGVFHLQAEAGSYILYFQHILYNPFSMTVSGNDVGTVILTDKENLLSDITVTAERPQVKVEGGTLIYDTPQLIKNKPVTNAFEAIRELPGVMGTDDSIMLLGASNLSIVINGQLTSMTLDQLIALLKTMPASRVKSTEIMYNAPARYNVKGALINVVLDQATGDGETLQGEVGSEYRQQHYARGIGRANLLYAKHGFSVDVLLNGTKGRTYSSEEMFARHTLPGEMVEITQDNGGTGKYNQGTFRLGMDYVLKNQDKLSASYYIEAGKSKAERFSSTVYHYLLPDTSTIAESRTSKDSDSRLQNAQIQYNGHQGITVGADYTNYHSPDEQHFQNNQTAKKEDLLNNSRQDIHKWMIFVNHSFKIKEDWGVNYGVNLNLTRSHTEVDYSWKSGSGYVASPTDNLDDLQKEWGGNAFAEVSRTFGKFSADISLKLEYFRSDYDSNGITNTLWDDWALFPNASLSYMFNPTHILQLSVSSDKEYPSYWSINPQINYLNSYNVIVGNPALKPSRSYEMQLVYILKQKYVFLTFMDYKPDRFIQLPYQEENELQSIFRFENLDYSMMNGVAVITPFRVGKVLDSRFTVYGVRMREKSNNFHTFSFDNSCVFARVALNNTIPISEAKPNLKLTIDGYYVSPAQQGVYKLGYSYDVSAGLKWSFAGDKGSLVVKYENIFRSHNPSYMKVDTHNQYSNMTLYDDSAYFGIAFNWKFGGYKEKKHEKVDDSRFGK